MKFSKILQLAFFVLASLLIVTIVLFIRLDEQVRDDIRLAQAAELVQSRFNRINAAMQTAQQSQRGFLLTQSEGFLAGFPCEKTTARAG